MIKVSRKLDYAILAVAHFCLSRGQVVSARSIAERYRIPLPILANILKLLARHGVIDSVRGVGGGYVLAAKPEELTLGELARVVEGPFRLADCVPDGLSEDGRCTREGCCPARDPIRRVHEAIQQLLDRVTFRELTEGAAAKLQGT